MKKVEEGGGSRMGRSDDGRIEDRARIEEGRERGLRKEERGPRSGDGGGSRIERGLRIE